MDLEVRLIPKVLDSDRGAVIQFFKQKNYCFPLILYLYVNGIVDFSSPTKEGSSQKQFVWENSSFFV